MNLKLVDVFCAVVLIFMGVIFGRALVEDQFFVIGNIHDLLESFAAIATIAAVGVAYVGINTWRSQISAATDHDLARRVAICVNKLTNEVLYLWGQVGSAATEVRKAPPPTGLRMYSLFRDGIQNRVSASESFRAEIKTLQFECRALWGDDFSFKFDELMQFEYLCVQTCQSFINWQEDGLDSIRLSIYARLVLSGDKWLVDKGLDKLESVNKYLKEITADLDSALKEKMLR
ncbi:MAG: hypothetical protein AAAB16_25335 [Pseudomonas sp.]|uniref:hypothetical protein n=1 Tax=Pseudomonas sp. TaxID=306 RepID=UPI0030F0BAC6